MAQPRQLPSELSRSRLTPALARKSLGCFVYHGVSDTASQQPLAGFPCETQAPLTLDGGRLSVGGSARPHDPRPAEIDPADQRPLGPLQLHPAPPAKCTLESLLARANDHAGHTHTSVKPRRRTRPSGRRCRPWSRAHDDAAPRELAWKPLWWLAQSRALGDRREQVMFVRWASRPRRGAAREKVGFIENTAMRHRWGG